MMFTAQWVVVGLILLKSANVYSQDLRNPCHANKRTSSPCTTVSLPPGFCSACQFGSYNSVGHYDDCTRTFNIDYNDNTCIDALQNYVDINTCDTARTGILADFKSSLGTDEAARSLLDFFYYALCEEGCDCIPQAHSDRNNPVVDIFRGNCQAHAHFDICSILPDIELIKLEGTPDAPGVLPKACPLLNTWIRGPDGRTWPADAYVPVHPDLQYFLERMTEAEQLATNLEFFGRCMDLEIAQGRIDEISLDDFYVEGQGLNKSPFFLVIAPTNSVLQPSLFDFAIVDLDVFGSALNIKFEPSVTGVVKVVFKRDDVIVQTEIVDPYSMAGNDLSGNYLTWTPVSGSTHRIEVEALDASDAVLETKSISVSFCTGCSATCSGCPVPSASPSVMASVAPSATESAGPSVKINPAPPPLEGQFDENIVYRHSVLENDVEWEARVGTFGILNGANGDVLDYFDHYGITIPSEHHIVLTDPNTFDPASSKLLNIPIDCTMRDDLFRITYTGVGKNLIAQQKTKNKFCSWFVNNNQKFCPLVDLDPDRSVVDPTSGEIVRPRIWQTCHQECDEYTHCAAILAGL